MTSGHVRNESLHSDQWMDYIHREAKALCEKKNWQLQIRRNWSVRHQVVSGNHVSSLEWKLLLQNEPVAIPENWTEVTHDESYEGSYYVLSYEYDRRVFVFQHSTFHAGMDNPSHDVTTYSEIHVPTLKNAHIGLYRYIHWNLSESHHLDGIPPDRWLSCHLECLVNRFPPNRFCIT